MTKSQYHRQGLQNFRIRKQTQQCFRQLDDEYTVVKTVDLHLTTTEMRTNPSS